MGMGGGPQGGYGRSWSEWELDGRGGAPMDLDVMRYAGFATSPFQGNVQFDRHPTDGGVGWAFGAKEV